RL
ncbi:peptidase S41 family protein, partial [Chlamydia psittaci 84-8471/1]